MTNADDDRFTVPMTDPGAGEPVHGVAALPPAPLLVRAGPVTALLDGTDLRRIRLGDAEIVRRVTIAVRDLHWNTVPGTVSNLELQRTEGAFHVEFDARSRGGGIDLGWRGSIHGDVDGVISYAFDGIAKREYEYARIGICVLHAPAEHRGRAYRASGEGHVSAGTIPDLIAPQRFEGGIPLALFPPYDELAIALAHGGEVRFAFDGDLFELEDQRNWTDASFKSYSTPFALGTSHRARRGGRISQRVTVRTAGAAASPAADAPLELCLGAATRASLPAIGFGFGAGADRAALSPRDAALLRAAAPDHLRLELDLAASSWTTALRDAIGVCRVLGCGLELALSVDGESGAPLDALGIHLDRQPVARVLVFARGAEAESPAETTPPELMALARQHLGSRLLGVPIGGGTDMYFAELNRTPPELRHMGIVSFAVMPQVHADDDTSLFEALEGQADAVRSGLVLAAGRPLAVGPISLRHRRPIYGPAIDPRGLPDKVDLRQASRLLAAWTVGSVKACAEAGASALTYFEMTGPCGLLEREDAVPLRGFPSAPGMVFPVHAVFRELARHKGSSLVTCSSTGPLDVCGLAFRHHGATTLLAANMTPEHRTVRVAHFGGEPSLDEIAGGAVVIAARDRPSLEIGLQPYSVASLRPVRDTEGEDNV